MAARRQEMSREARRRIITTVVVMVAVLIVTMVIVSRMGGPPAAPPAPPTDEGPDAAVVDADGPDGDVDVADPDAAPPAVAEVDDEPAAPPAPVDEAVSLDGLRAVAPEGSRTLADGPVAGELGSLDPLDHRLYAELSYIGAGLSRIVASNHWTNALATHQAEDHVNAVLADRPTEQVPPLPPEEFHYVLQTEQPLRNWQMPALAAHSLMIDGRDVPLVEASEDPAGGTDYIWGVTAPGRFETTIVNVQGEPVARVIRQFTLDDYDVRVVQRVENLTARPLDIRWSQYGPTDMPQDFSRYIDRRRFRIGYLESPQRDPQRAYVYADNRFLVERSEVVDGTGKVWPTDEVIEDELTLSWFASTNRYFALTVHPPGSDDGPATRSLEYLVEQIAYGNAGGDTPVFTQFFSPVRTVAPGEQAVLDFGLFAGPMDRELLNEIPLYRALNLDALVLYQMSSWGPCAFCTFQWLARFLLLFLDVLHDWVLFDWGLAIIALVVVVRALLHPITKRSQINMMRFQKQVQKLQPEMEKLREKYKDDQKRQQQEQLQLFRQHGVNPLQMLGCLPMFLQMPVWVALYAMLYFAFELRHEPALFGIFQTLGGWPFLADLSAPDRFIPLFADWWTPRVQQLFIYSFDYTAINVLPLLMGLAFFLQQKYMSPPPSANMTPEQVSQQRIMKVMIVVLFPIMLYSAPSGLTLYILTSSTIGMIESRYIRSHVNAMDLDAPPKKPPAAVTGKPKKPKDPQARAYAAALERAKQKKAGPPKRFKKRK